MEQDITCKKEKELFFSYLGSLGLGVLLLLLIAFLYFYNNYKKAISSNSITSPINNLNYSIILYGKNRCKKIITQRVV